MVNCHGIVKLNSSLCSVSSLLHKYLWERYESISSLPCYGLKEDTFGFLALGCNHSKRRTILNSRLLIAIGNHDLPQEIMSIHTKKKNQRGRIAYILKDGNLTKQKQKKLTKYQTQVFHIFHPHYFIQLFTITKIITLSKRVLVFFTFAKYETK